MLRSKQGTEWRVGMRLNSDCLITNVNEVFQGCSVPEYSLLVTCYAKHSEPEQSEPAKEHPHKR